MYDNGDRVPDDDTEADKCYQLAAGQGHVNAQFNLGVMYANGEGVTQGYSESYVWWSLTVMPGNKNLAEIRDHATEKLTAEKLNLAQQRVAELFDDIQRKYMN